MDSLVKTAICFPYPVTARCPPLLQRDALLAALTETINKLISCVLPPAPADTVKLVAPESIHPVPRLDNFFVFNFNIVISGLLLFFLLTQPGPPNFVIDAKGQLLRKNPSQVFSNMFFAFSNILDNNYYQMQSSTNFKRNR